MSIDNQIERPALRYTPDAITSLEPNEVFVFGSNTRGFHAGGAAKLALDKFGARWGEHAGHHGQSYAIPTMFANGERAPLFLIEEYIGEFIDYAAAHPDLTFLVTQIGCGLAGFTPAEIGPLFFTFAIPVNVVLPDVFWKEGMGE